MGKFHFGCLLWAYALKVCHILFVSIIDARYARFIVLHSVSQPSAAVCRRLHCVSRRRCTEPRVTFDTWLTMRHHVDNVMCSCFFQLRQLRSVRRSLTHEALPTLVHAFTSSCVDYCNAVLHGVIRRLQSVLHAAARLITGIRRNEHITPTLRDTLQLPISQRITFKIALMMFDCSCGRRPKYSGDVYTAVHTVAARSRLRSADHDEIVVPRSRSTRCGCRSFLVCGQTFWNKLPQDLRSTDTREQFKRRLKAWLFECAYGRHTLTKGAPYKWTLLTYLFTKS